MNNDEGRIGFSVELDDTKLRQQISNSQRAFEQLADNVEADGARMDDAIGNVGNTLAQLGAAYSLKEFATKVADVRGEFQKLQVAMETMLQSKTKADALMAQMVQTAATTPFDLMQVTNGAKQLLAYGLEADKVNETLIRLGDIAAGLSIPLGDLVYLYGTTMTQGRLYTQDFNQFVGRGIPLIGELAKQFGVAENKVKDLVEEGKVGFPEIQKVIEDLTNEGGMFGGLMDKQSQTISGQIANIEDAFDMMFNEIGQNNEGMINSALSGVSTLVENYGTVAEALGTLVASYGVYKATLMAVTAYTNSAYRYEIAQLKAVVAEKTMEIDADLQSAVTKGRMTASRAQEVQALRLELAAKIESAKATAVEAEAEASAATTKRMSAQLAYQKAQAEVQAKEEEIFAMEGLYAMQTAETLQKEKDVLVTKMHAAQAKLDAATQVEVAAKTKAATTAQAVNTLTTQRDTIAKKTNGAATTLLTLCTNGLTRAMNALKTAWATNPVGIIVMGLTLVAGAVMTACDAFESAEDSISDMSEKFGEGIDKTVRSVDTLWTVINNTRPTSKAHEDAVNELCKIYEEYGIKIDEERDKLEQLNEKREEAIRLIKEEGEERMNANLISSYDDAIESRMEKMRKAIIDAFQNAEWEGTGYFDDYDATEFQKKADEATKIVNAMIESEIGDIRKLSAEYDGLIDNSDRQKAVWELTSKISNALEEIGLKGLALTDINLSDYIRDAADDTENLANARDKLADSMRNNADAADDEAAAVDVTTMSFEELFKAANNADEQITTTKQNLQLIGNITATPSINTSSLDNAINQTNMLINNMLYLNGQIANTSNGVMGLQYQMPTLSMPKLGLNVGGPSLGFSGSLNTSLSGNNDVAKAKNELESRMITAMKTRKGVTDLLKEVNAALQTAEGGSSDEKELIALQKRLNAQKEKFDKAEGKGSKGKGKTETAAERAAKIQKAELEVQKILQESAQSREQMQKDLQQQEEQMSIDLEADAAAKRRRQLELDQQKEQDQLQQQMEAAIKAETQRQKQYFDAVENTKAARNKDYVKKNFTDADVDQTEIDKIQKQYDVLFQRLQEQQKRDTEKSAREELKNELMAMADYLKSYGTLQQQKYAIAKEYAEKIREVNEGNGTTEEKQWKIKSIEKERDAAITQTNAKNLAMSIDWGTAFEGVGNVLKDVARETLSKLDEYMKTDEYKKLSAENKKTYTELQNKLRQETETGSTSPFNFKIWSDISKNVSDYQQSVRTLQERTKAHTQAVEELEQAQNDLTKATDDTSKALAQKAVDVAQGKVEATAASQNEAQEASNKARQTLTDNTNAAAQGIKNFTNYLNEMSKGSLYGFANGMSKLITSLAKGSDGIGKSLNELGGKIGAIVGAILQILDALGDDPKGFIDDLLNKVADVVEQILEDLPEIVITVLKDVGNILQGVVSGIASWFGADDLFGLNGNEKQVENTINRLTERNELLQAAIEDLTDEIKASKGTKSVAAYRSAYDLQKETNANYLGMAQAQASYWKHHHSWNYYWKGFTADQTDWIKKNVKNDFNGDIWSLSPEEMKKLRSNVGIWEYIKGTGKGGYGDSVTDKLDDYIDQAGKLEELTNELYEGLTGISFDSMYDSFIDTLMDMDASAADAAEKMSEYFMRAMLSNKIGELYADKLEDWWKKFGASMEDGELTEAERKSLQDEYMGYVDEAMKLRDELAKATGYDAIASSQDTEKQGFATASQDSIDELNGRFTAVQMDTSVIRETLSTIQTNMGTLNLSALAIKQQTEEIRNISLLAIDHLENIAKNTHELYEMNERLGKIEKNTRKI